MLSSDVVVNRRVHIIHIHLYAGMLFSLSIYRYVPIYMPLSGSSSSAVYFAELHRLVYLLPIPLILSFRRSLLTHSLTYSYSNACICSFAFAITLSLIHMHQCNRIHTPAFDAQPFGQPSPKLLLASNIQPL